MPFLIFTRVNSIVVNLFEGGDDMSDLHKHHNCFQYTALGNSIAFGKGASFTVNDPENHGYGYVYYLRDFLSTIFPCVNLINLANPGDTSTDLLQKLQTDVFKEAVKKADVITISIGGNDLLNCVRVPQPPPIIAACLSNAVATFAQNWPLIMREIRKSIRSHAEILVMTIYDPFNDENPLVKTAIQNINNVIKANRFTFHYKVVDVHADFLGQFTNTTQSKICLWTHFCEPPVPPDFLPNPHPTDSGHLEIARLHELTFLKNHPDKLRLIDNDPRNDESSSDES